MIIDFPAYRPLLISLLRNAFEALPLPLFLVCMQWAKPVVSADWRMPYFASTVAAIATTAWVVYRKETLNRIYLGLNLYFLSGSIGLMLHWTWLNDTYGRIEATGMLLWIAAVGAISTVSSKAGFIAIDTGQPKLTERKSLQLLVTAVCVTGLSWWFQGNVLLSAYIPFVVLFAAHSLLRAQAMSGITIHSQ
jgi:formate-dependent nitrite reductase membrane component NrfD